MAKPADKTWDEWRVKLVDGSVIECYITDDIVAKVLSGKIAFMAYLPLGTTIEPGNWTYINVDQIFSLKLLE